MEDRRRFLKVLGGSVLAAGMAPFTEACSSGESTGAGGAGAGGAGAGSVSSSSDVSSSSSGPPCGVGVSVGMPADYAVDGLHKVTMPLGSKVLIGHDADGFYALSSVCTHFSCDLNTKGSLLPNGIACNCHFSRFDSLGNVTMGPALKPLPALALSIGCDGTLYVDTKTQVDISVRLMP